MGKRQDEVDVERVRKLWDEDIPSQEICKLCEITRSTLTRIYVKHGFRKRSKSLSRACVADPTPSEIAERSAEVRKSWSEREARRRSGDLRDGVSLAHYYYDHRHAAFSY